MLLRALALGLLLASAAGARAAAYCVPGTPTCCPEGVAAVVPTTRGMTPQQAREALLKEGFSNIGRLARPTDGFPNPCWARDRQARGFVDHILLGGAARDWVVRDSFHVLVYVERDPALRDRISDHCPISVRLDPR